MKHPQLARFQSLPSLQSPDIALRDTIRCFEFDYIVKDLRRRSLGRICAKPAWAFAGGGGGSVGCGDVVDMIFV